MFCRSCWANLPDGTEACPRCRQDPRVPVAPARSVASSAAAPARPGAPLPPLSPKPPKPEGGPESGAAPRRTAHRLARLNILLGGLLVVLIAGPPLARWYERSRTPPAGDPARAGAADQARASAARAEAPLPATEVREAPAPSGAAARLAGEAFTLFQAGRIAEACDRYRDLVAREGTEAFRRNLAACLARLGRDLYQANQAAGAVEHYQRAVEAYPAGREHWAALAIALVKAGDLGRAQRVLGEASRAFPDDPDLLYQLADVQERQGQTREAVETLRRLLAAHPSHARGRTLLASLEREQTVEGGYWSQESRHFLVRYEDAGGIDVGRSIVDVLEQAYESMGRDLGVYPKDRVQVGIYVTKTFAQIGGIPPEYAEHVLGFYDFRKVRLRLSASNADSISLERLARHEYAHHVIHLATNGRATRWLHEGLAQVLEPRGAPRFIETDVVLDRQHLTLDGLERLFRSNAVGAAYQLSHVVAEYLVGQRGMNGMRLFLERLGQGEPVPQALRSSIGVGPEDVEARLLAAGGRS